MRPSSPARSNSTSSIATQSSYATPATNKILSNPPLVAGTIPGVSAGNIGSGFVSVVPMTATPQTQSSAAKFVSGAKRDASESEKEDGGHETKKRRIAPTLVGDQVVQPGNS